MLSRIAVEDDAFFANLFTLLDCDESGCLCLQEFAGGLQKLGRGREVPNKQITELTQFFLENAGADGDLDVEQFTDMCREFKLTPRLFQLFDLDGSGKVDVTEFMMGLHKLARCNTDLKWFAWAETWFVENASPEGTITKEQFFQYLNVKKSLFAERLFEIIDTDGSGTVDVTELMRVIHVLTQGTPKERLMMLFSVYDIDGNGNLNKEEVGTVLQWCLADSSLDEKGEILEKLTSTLFEQMDNDKSGDVSLAEFELFLNQYPQIAENLTISFSKCLRPDKKKKPMTFAKLRRNYRRTMSTLKNNKPFIGFWFIYISVNVALFMTAAAKYWTANNIFVVLARGPGQCLNFNSAFIVVLMYRRILTYLRTTRVRKYLPLDHSIMAHKVIGIIILIFSLVHTAMHVVNFQILSTQTNVTWSEFLFTCQPGLGWVEGSASITGWVLVLILILIVLTSAPWCRRRGYFELFYWCHWLFIAWWVALVIHAPNFWKWLVGPAILYLLQKLWPLLKGRGESISIIKSIRSVDSKISEVIIKRPRRFKFNAGDYIFIKIQAIAKFEFHPFTISSAPEESDFISLHILAVGDWTKRLRAMGQLWTHRSSVVSEDTTFSSILHDSSHDNDAFVDEKTTTSSILDIHHRSLTFGESRKLALPVGEKNPVTLLTAKPKVVPDINTIEANLPDSPRSSFEDAPRKVKVMIDGPYGAPATNVYSVGHAVLIGAGIGVTPFASLLKSMMFRRKRRRAICPNCNYWWKVPEADSLTQVPRKVDFIWVTRTFATLEWFLDVLGELEEEEARLSEEERFLNLSLHVTAALGQSDIRAVALQMALELCYQKEARDPLCGLRTRIQPGRPNWQDIFQKIRAEKTGRVCVFYCGPPQLEKVLKKVCSEYHLDFRSENF
ncbi:NADPH oxidase 5-like [Liolophura sinensis]|uniref:NADPH oxidase 5-like n=1 Tax=Liolophura sinensis TaxID=3198878 RepID=UPI003158DBB3